MAQAPRAYTEAALRMRTLWRSTPDQVSSPWPTRGQIPTAGAHARANACVCANVHACVHACTHVCAYARSCRCDPPTGLAATQPWAQAGVQRGCNALAACSAWCLGLLTGTLGGRACAAAAAVHGSGVCSNVPVAWRQMPEHKLPSSLLVGQQRKACFLK